MVDVVVYTDGASRGNPGEGGIGVVLTEPDGQVLEEIGEYVGQVTNNVAEYMALIRGLERAIALGARSVAVCSDSELMVRQLNGQYKVKNAGLRPLFEHVKKQIAAFDRFEIQHVRRKQNARADQLANDGIDRHER